MATRSTIAMQQPDGRIMQIYCHWDGYLDSNGLILQEHYTDQAKILALMMLGSISSLKPEIGQAHDFDARYDKTDPRSSWTVAYHRDRGEDLQSNVFKDLEDYTNNSVGEEYNYIFRDGQWYVEFYGSYNGTLAEAFAFKELEDAE